MFFLNGKPVRLDADLTVGEGDEAITYPAMSLLNAELRAEIGIVEVPDPVRPDDRLYFVTENADGTYDATPRPRDQVTAPVWNRIQARREYVKAGGVQVAGKWFHTDDASRIQQIGMAMMGASIPPGLQWKTMDGTFVAMTPELASQVFQAVAALDIAAFTAAEQHRAAMEVSENPFEYDYSAGWPIAFADARP
jgi:hypothetical protein